MEHIHLPHIDLLAVIEAHCAASGMSKSGFGAMAVGDPRFVDDLRSGREPRRKTVNRVLEFISTARKQSSGAAQ
jgi:hypothetical protein